jgi:N-acetylglucosamine-6-phosphate deacetylase
MRVELPGFFDLQVNGFGGIDFNDPAISQEEFARAIAAQRATGVTRFLPTLITSPFEPFARCARTLAACTDPAVAGIHMEGPYLAYDARGAHPPEHLAPASIEDFQRRQEAAGGRIVLVTLAPEVPGALPLVEHLVASGVRVAIGHTCATAEQVREAVAAGASLSTHLGNGSPRVIPRHPNFIWEQLAADELVASLIVDGHHLAPSVVKVMVRAKGAERVVLVTDAIKAAAQPPGRYTIGAVDVELSPAGRVTLVGGDTLAGAAITMDAEVANTVRFTGLPLEVAAAMASTGPARVVGQAAAGRVIADWDPERCALRVERVVDA